MGRRARVSREQVLAAARAAFSERGYDGTTLARIASRLDVSPAALLRHAPDKASLFREAMAPAPGEVQVPVGFLEEAPADADPRRLLRRVARALVPHIEDRLGESVVRWMHERGGRHSVTLRLPFRPGSPGSPPRRALELLESWMRRASRAGTLRVRSPRAAAVFFLGSLQAYVFLHRVLRIVHPAVPLERYLDTVLEIWSRGGIRPGRRRR